MASGHMNRVKRPDTWLHRPMLRNVKKVLANPEPSTHLGQSSRFRSSDVAIRKRSYGAFDLHQSIHAEGRLTSTTGCCPWGYWQAPLSSTRKGKRHDKECFRRRGCVFDLHHELASAIRGYFQVSCRDMARDKFLVSNLGNERSVA